MSSEVDFRTATGDGMGMDYAFFSTSLNEQTAAEFAGSADYSTLFEIEYFGVARVQIVPCSSEDLVHLVSHVRLQAHHIMRRCSVHSAERHEQGQRCHYRG
jgi:hypothetical protein